MVPPRPRYTPQTRPRGTVGRQITVTVNAYEVIQKETSDFYIYDAIATRARPNIDILVKSEENRIPLNSQRAHEIVDKMKASYPNPWASMSPAYDGRKLLVSSSDAINEPTQFLANISAKNINDPKNTGVLIVTVSRVLHVHGGSYRQLINGAGEDDDSKAFIQALQLLLRMAPILGGNGGTPHNSRSVFTPAGKRPIGVYELWRGIFQSVRPSIGRLIVNVDTVAAYIYTPGMPIIEFIGRSLGMRNPRDLDNLAENTDEWRLLKTLVKRVSVSVTVPPTPANVPPRRRAIRDVVVDIGTYMFNRDMGNGHEEPWSVRDYYLDVHEATPRYKLGLQFGTNTRPVVIPADFCVLAPGQILKRSLTAEQTREMLEFTKTRPRDRMDQIQQAVTGPFLNYSQSEYIQRTGLQISNRPIQATARMLPRPSIEFARPHNVQQPVLVEPQEDTSWRIMDKIFYNTTSRPSCWAVVNFSDARNEQVMTFAQQLQQRCAARGMNVRGLNQPSINGNNQNPGASLDAALAQYHVGQPDGPPPEQMMILVVLPRANRGGEQRKATKFWGDCVRGVVTQCMKQEKVQQQGGSLDQYCNNMAVKINAKLGGTNSLPRSGPVTNMLHKGRFIVFGADVGHPGPGITDRPSICSLTASIDPDATRYISRAFIQHPRQETMDPTKLESMVLDCLVACTQKNNGVPANLLFYRDGVSEGEFEKVSDFEIPAIEGAWNRFWTENYDVMKRHGVQFVPEEKKIPRLQLTFVVVGKRHHFKFFPNQGTPFDKSGNVKGGFVVDQDIVAPTTLDFYLQSHGGLLGTSRSSHYTVLANTTGSNGEGMSVDLLQGVSHYLCYAYARATRAVSIPAPVYYADLICDRARFHLNDAGQAFSEGGSGDFNENYWNSIFREVHQSQRNRPFFM